MPVFTQDAGDYDVLIVADEGDVFGEYLPYRTWDARPVAGSVGLVPVSWSRVQEQWGGTQVQRRFEKFAGRPMTERDYGAWLAVRAIGEAVTRSRNAEPAALHDYMVGDEFEVAAFKGQGLTFRRWDQQMRQPMLLVTPRMLVSVSPQDQFLHQRTPLDTLGLRRAREPLPPQLTENRRCTARLILALLGAAGLSTGAARRARSSSPTRRATRSRSSTATSSR